MSGVPIFQGVDSYQLFVKFIIFGKVVVKQRRIPVLCDACVAKYFSYMHKSLFV
jgi:hypothetical protein